MVSDERNGGQFYNSCNEELDFQTHDYEVCMQDMLFPSSGLDTVVDGGNHILIMIDPIPRRQIDVYVRPGYYKTAQQLMRAINVAIDGFGEIVERGANFEYNADSKYNIHPCDELALQMGGIHKKGAVLFLQNGDYVHWINNTWKMEVSKIKPTLKLLQMISVYADFIENTMIGPNVAPLLRIVPIQFESGIVEHVMFSLQYYIPVKRCKIREFGITIREGVNGHVMNLRDVVTIILHFRVRE